MQDSSVQVEQSNDVDNNMSEEVQSHKDFVAARQPLSIIGKGQTETSTPSRYSTKQFSSSTSFGLQVQIMVILLSPLRNIGHLTFPTFVFGDCLSTFVLVDFVLAEYNKKIRP
jgi:hypothetical protein